MDCMRDGFEGGKSLNGRFITIAPLNHGSFGMVFSAKDVVTGSDVAIKCITKADTVRNCAAYPTTVITDEHSEELAIHSRLSLHPNIVNLIHHFETDAHQYMALELCSNGDLYEAIRNQRGPLETEHVRAFLLELIDAIEHLHQNGVYHRDIKPENIFLTSTGAMKLGDFGLATTDTWSTEFAVGSDRYMAPEQFQSSVYGFGYSPAAADIWAIGIVLLNVLFERNPFAFPTEKDPLFADFKADRQSLYDIFPKMTRDTFDVLVHCLAVDPANRSLGAVRNAVHAVRSFTEDDETLEDAFCTEQSDQVAVASSAREPLRTPSITSPNVDGDSFFTPGLLKTPQKPVRQLSTIHDDDLDLFPEGPNDAWQYTDTDQASVASNVDSGLGMSYKSSKSMKSMKSNSSFLPAISSVVGSLPISFNRPANKFHPYGGDGSGGMSKSWSDMIEEDFAMQEDRSSIELDMDLEEDNTPKPTLSRGTTSGADSGSATPRPILAEYDVNVIRSASPAMKPAEQAKVDVDLPKQRNPLLDKWSALGNMRRAKPEPSSVTATPTTQKSKYTEAFANFSPFSSTKKQKSPDKSRDRTPGWRQGSPERLRSTNMNRSQVWSRQDSPTQGPQNWELDNNWRQHKPPVPKMPSPASSPTTIAKQHSNDRRKNDTNFFDTNTSNDKTSVDNDTGDFEWVVGGLKFDM